MIKDIIAAVCILVLIVLNIYSMVKDEQRKQHIVSYILYFLVAAGAAVTIFSKFF